MLKHGLSKSKEYKIWSEIKHRCFNTNFKQYKDYGGRGITIHAAWKNNFCNFYAYLISTIGPKPDGMSIDRIDNDGNYAPGNLKWSTPLEQNRNQRQHRRTRKRVRRKHNKSGYLGVCPHGKKFQAEIEIDGKTKYLGVFETAVEASLAYQAALAGLSQ